MFLAQHVSNRTSCTPSLLAAFLFLACASGSGAPDWIDGQPAAYGAQRWIAGVGSAASPQRAAEEALARVAEATLGLSEGASIVETWSDASRRLHWALAVLERAPARRRTELLLLELERDAQAALARAAGAPAHEGLDAVLQGLALVSQRAQLQRRLSALGGPPAPADDALGDALRARLAAQKRALPIEISAAEMDPKTGAPGDAIDELRRELAARVTGLGFPVGTPSWDWREEPSWLLVDLRLALDSLDLPDRDQLVAVHWDAALEITDRDGNLIAVLTEEGRSTQTSEREARRRAREEAERFAGAALEHWLTARITP